MSAASKLLRYGREIPGISLCLAALACQSSPSTKMQPVDLGVVALQADAEWRALTSRIFACSPQCWKLRKGRTFSSSSGRNKR